MTLILLLLPPYYLLSFFIHSSKAISLQSQSMCQSRRSQRPEKDWYLIHRRQWLKRCSFSPSFHSITSLQIQITTIIVNHGRILSKHLHVFQSKRWCFLGWIRLWWGLELSGFLSDSFISWKSTKYDDADDDRARISNVSIPFPFLSPYLREGPWVTWRTKGILKIYTQFQISVNINSSNNNKNNNNNLSLLL